jgi:hypothetical protein
MSILLKTQDFPVIWIMLITSWSCWRVLSDRGPTFLIRSGMRTAAKECLQLYLCSHRDFSKGATEFACRDMAICRSKPWAWVARLGVHSRIRKGRRHFKVLRRRSIKASRRVHWDYFFPEKFPEHQYDRFLSYRWALDLLPFLLEQSPVSLELADVLRGYTLAMMAWRFPRSMRLAKEAIGKYLLRVDSAVGDP